MSQTKVSESKKEAVQVHVKGEDEFLKQLDAIWSPFQRQGLEVRFKMGKLLNAKLGPPKARQQHGMGTIERICDKLQIDKSDVSRMRRFAAMADTIDEFRKNHDELKTWTHVREMLALRDNKPAPPNDAKVSAGVLRSINSVIDKFNRDDYEFKGSASDDKLIPALRELFKLAQDNLDFKLED